MATLVVLRHSKSDYPAGVPDHDRPLSERGRRDAPAAGRWLAQQGLVPKLVLVSTAVRTQQTWQLAGAELGSQPPVRSEPLIYEASVRSLLDVIAAAPAEVSLLAVVGHNPGLEDLCRYLAGSGDRDAYDAMTAKFPTSGVAVLGIDRPWAELSAGCAVLTEFAVPRG